MPLSQRPTGTVTFLFTDIGGSTKLWESHPDAMRASLARHDALMRQAIGASNGYVFKTIGDAFCAAFSTAAEALEAVLAAQLALTAEPWPEETPIRVRMALHTGAVEYRDNDYFGPPVNRVARLLSTAHGGQIVLSQTSFDLVRDSLPSRTSIKDLGSHQLKDLARPEQVFQLLHPDLPANFAALKSLSSFPNNLPQQLTTFIGRETELEKLQSLIQSNRLVTLTGSGGTGKSRLSLQVAASILERYPDGVWLVELAPITDPELVISAVAETMGVKEEPGATLHQALVEYLKSRKALIILDNCEHLIQSIARLAESLLRACPDIQILASSREALGVAGERTYRVPSLSLPDPKESHTPDSLSQFEAVRLFIDRATLARPDFSVTNENAPAVASLCFHLDGIPFAIELAAARVRSLAIEEIDRKLDQRFRLLTGGSRTALPRQQTLRALIDWSYELLNDAEKALLNRLSVFAGGWGLEDAEAVCDGDPIEAWEILDLLTSLSDKSLIVNDELMGVVRFRLLETVRQYGQDRLSESGVGQVWKDRHLDHFVALAEEASSHFRGPHQKSWFERMDTEQDNLRTALEWAAENAGSEQRELRLATALHPWWSVRGHYSEGRARLEHAVRADADSDPALRCKALIAIGRLALNQKDVNDAEASFLASLELAEGLGDKALVAAALRGISNVHWHFQDLEGCTQLSERSLALCQEMGDRDGEATTLILLGLVAINQGRQAEGIATYERCLTFFKETGHVGSCGLILGNLGGASYSLGDFERSRKYFQESLEIRRELGDQFGIAGSLMYMGLADIQLGELDSATNSLEEALVMFERLGNKGDTALSLLGLGRLALLKDEVTSARERADQAIRIWKETRGPISAVYGLELLAMISLREGKPETAVRLLGYAERTREESKVPPYPWEKREQEVAMAPIRQELGDSALNAMLSEGRNLTFEEAIDLAHGRPAQ